MDHLPLPQSSLHAPVLLRENAFYHYVYSPPFHTYPARQGYDLAEFFDFATSTFTYGSSFKSTFASFAQSWLYFGVLAEFFDGPLQLCDWTLEKEDGVSVICTSHLCERIDRWRQDLLEAPEVERFSRKRDLAYLLDRGQYFLSNLSHGFDFTFAADFLPQDLLLSIQVLYSTLNIALKSVGVETRGGNNARLRILQEQFHLNGWCESDIMRLRQDASILGEYYASRLGPLSFLRDHGDCSPELCVAAQVKMEEYNTQHISPDCRCNFAGLETATLALHIMKDGKGTPLLSLNKDSNLIILTSATTTSEYVAISHVWADGLGNPRSNTLPLCQLIRIQNQVNSLFPPSESTSTINHPFWMDTIGVPVGEVFREQRSKAIVDMARIYASASKVLIFNKELEGIESTRDLVELATRAGRTSWFRRLWTLHEGILSLDSYFQFKGAAISMDTMLDAPSKVTSSSQFRTHLENALMSEACTPMTKLSAFKSLPHEERIRHVWDAVQWRATSNADDETICLANMLGLDLSPILRIPRDAPNVTTERMKAFIKEQRYFPTASLFESGKDPQCKQARILETGYRWAPKSFVFRTVKPKSGITESPLAIADRQGLHVHLPGLLLSWGDIIEGEHSLTFNVADEWDYWYSARWLDEEIPSWHVEHGKREVTTPAIILEKDLVMSRGYSGRDKGFIMEQLDNGDMDSFSITSFSDNCNGLFVLIKRDRAAIGGHSSRQGGLLSGKIVGSVIVEKREFSSAKRPAYEQIGVAEIAQKRREKLLFLETVPPTQEWCVG
jgi:hypothetical protein